MGYRPICDVWLLARPKLSGGRRYYGCYPSGFLPRARALLGVGPQDSVLHVCGGMVRHHVFGALGRNDRTVDIDPRLKPDYVMDVSRELPIDITVGRWPAILADPPYSPEDAAQYRAGAKRYPEPTALLARCIEAVRPGGRVGFLHTLPPRPPKGVKCVALIGVIVGFGNRARVFSVFERAP